MVAQDCPRKQKGSANQTKEEFAMGSTTESESPSRARRVRFGPPDRLSPLGEVYLQPTLTAGHGTGEGGSREREGEKMVWEPDRFNARVAHRLFMTARSKRRRARRLYKSVILDRTGRIGSRHARATRQLTLGSG